MRSEAQVESDCWDLVKDADGIMLKLSTAFFVGIPDRLILAPGHTAFFVEFKREKKVPGRRQKFVHGLLRDMGFNVYVVDQVDQFKAIFKREMQR